MAATLLVIELEVPESTSLTNELIFHWSRVFVAWIDSFIMVVVWLDNHMFLSTARQWSLKLTLFTFMQLGAVSLIPFASTLMAASAAGHFQHPLFGVILWAFSPILIALTARMKRAT